MMYKIKKLLFIIIAVSLVSCSDQEECFRLIQEERPAEYADAHMVQEAFEYHEILLKRFKESPINGENHDVYHWMFYSSHGFGKSIKFERIKNDYFLKTKCLTNGDWNANCKDYQINISKDEWNEFEKMIFEFNFWTEQQQFRGHEGVLDGIVYYLEGNRTGIKKCGKKVYKLVGRGSPQYDRIGALCDNIGEYEDYLAFKYGKREE